MDDAGRMDCGELFREIRRRCTISQRELAAITGLPASTIDRIESGQIARPRLDVIERVLLATGLAMEIVDKRGAVVELESQRQELRDRGFRHFPAHLRATRVRNMDDPWSGWYKRAFWDNDPNRPDWTYWHRSKYRKRSWADAGTDHVT